jgi:hypothetical protein
MQMSRAALRGREYFTHDRWVALIGRIRSEYLEMPGLRLTVAQAARLWAEDRQITERLLDELTVTGFLHKDRAGAYLRASLA